VEAGSPQGGSDRSAGEYLYLHTSSISGSKHGEERAHGDVIVVRYATTSWWIRVKTSRTVLERTRQRMGEISTGLTRKRRDCSSSDAMRARTESARSGKPETFDFLGLKHISEDKKAVSGASANGSQTMQAKLQQVKIELRRRMHDPFLKLASG